MKTLKNFLNHFLIYIKLGCCLEVNTKKYINFSAPIQKDITRTDKKGRETVKIESYQL